ncbi:MAG: phosphatase PAP2 family protein [Yaniella sp.]|nr:phosphatase PAP2 family protein [Yaniella sp.]
MCEDTLGKTRQIVGPVLIWLLVAAVIGALIEVPPWSADLYETMTHESLGDTGYISSLVVMLTLIIIYLGMALRTWLVKDNIPFVRLVFGAVATTVVYVVNLLLKDGYGKVRPCNVYETIDNCPPIDNFSYPSNHTVIAFGLAMGLAFALPWMAYLAFPLAIIEGVSRVLAGHHYPHDVVVGAVLGTLGVLGILLMFVKVQDSMATKLSASRSTAPSRR